MRGFIKFWNGRLSLTLFFIVAFKLSRSSGLREILRWFFLLILTNECARFHNMVFVMGNYAELGRNV